MTLSLWKENRLPSLTDTLTAGGVAVNLTGATVLFSMRNSLNAAQKIAAATATIVTAASGTVRYDWAAVDVDTVGTYEAWWTYSTLGKTQDTPEFEISIVEHGPASVAVPNPVSMADGGQTTIYKGDSYLAANGRALTYELAVVEAPDLTGTTVTWRVAATLAKTATIVGEDTVYVELTSTDTTALSPGSYAFELEADLGSSNKATLLRSNLIVLADMAGP